jgi:tetratricopeptide (TPR) repeat protein
LTEVARDLARARAMLDIKRYQEAAGLLAQFVASEPADSQAWCLLARAQLGANRNQDAAAAANRAVTLAPADDWPHRLASAAMLRLGNVPEAVRAAGEACRLAPHNWLCHLSLAQSALAQRNFYIAEQAAGNARMLAPTEPEAHVVSGKISLARGERAAARAYQERALALSPTHSDALNELGRIELRSSRSGNAQAARHFVEAARSAPEVSIYRQNVQVVVRRVVTRVIYFTSLATFAFLYVSASNHPARAVVVIGLGAVAVVSATIAALQLRRMPPEIRPLFRTRRVLGALTMAYGPILCAVLAAAVLPSWMLPVGLLAVAAAMIGLRFAANAILR